jgi:hypothetical protein
MDKIFIIILIVILLYVIYRLETSLNEGKLIVTETFNNDYELPKVIYGFWDDYDENKVIQSHVRTWKRNISPEWEIVMLNKDRKFGWVSSPFWKPDAMQSCYDY